MNSDIKHIAEELYQGILREVEIDKCNKFAVIGTRQLTQLGEVVIEDIDKRTFGK